VKSEHAMGVHVAECQGDGGKRKSIDEPGRKSKKQTGITLDHFFSRK